MSKSGPGNNDGGKKVAGTIARAVERNQLDSDVESDTEEQEVSALIDDIESFGNGGHAAAADQHSDGVKEERQYSAVFESYNNLPLEDRKKDAEERRKRFAKWNDIDLLDVAPVAPARERLPRN